MKYFTMAEAYNKVYITTDTNSILIYDIKTDTYSTDPFPRFLYNTVATNQDIFYFPREQDLTCYNPDTKYTSFLDMTPAAKHNANVVINDKIYFPCICDYDYDLNGTPNRIALMKIVNVINFNSPFLENFDANSILIDDKDDSDAPVGPTEEIKSCIQYNNKIYIPISNRGFDSGVFNGNLLEYNIDEKKVTRVYTIPKDDYGQCCILSNWLYLTAPGKVIKFNLLTFECQSAFDILGIPLSIMADRGCLYTITRKRIIKYDTRTNEMSEIATINLEQFIRDGNIISRDKYGVIKLIEVGSGIIKEISQVYFDFYKEKIIITDDWSSLLLDISDLYDFERKQTMPEIEADSHIIPPLEFTDEADNNIVIWDELGHIGVNETYNFGDVIWGDDRVTPIITIVSSVEIGINTIADKLGLVDIEKGLNIVFDELGNIKEIEADKQTPPEDELEIPEDEVEEPEADYGTIWGKDETSVKPLVKVINYVEIYIDDIFDKLGEIEVEKDLNIIISKNDQIKEIEADSQIKEPELEISEDEVEEPEVDYGTIWGKDETLVESVKVINYVEIYIDDIFDKLGEIEVEKDLGIVFDEKGKIKEIEADSQIKEPKLEISEENEIEEPEVNYGDIWGDDRVKPIVTIVSSVEIGLDGITDKLGGIDIKIIKLNNTVFDENGDIKEIEASIQQFPSYYDEELGYFIGDEVTYGA
jgi:hypothetical protein